MTDLNAQLREASGELQMGLEEASVGRLRGAVQQRVARRKRTRALLLTAAPLLVVAVLLGLRLAPAPSPGVAHSAPATGSAAARGLQLHDGSRVEPLGAGSQVRVVSEAAELVELELGGGAAHFQVTHNPARRFVVKAPPVEVEVVGTAFDIIRAAASVEVRVQNGRVQVRNGSTLVVLVGGESHSFSSQPADVVPAPAVASSAPPLPKPTASTGEADWRGLARAGKFAQAYAAMPLSKVEATGSVDELLLRADVARLSGHPAEAVQPLRQVLASFRQDSRAPSASFTLGGIYEQLGRHAEAGTAFAQTRALQPAGPLVEDALARETLALLASGQKAQGESLARRYLQRYPRGVRAQEIRRRTGLP